MNRRDVVGNVQLDIDEGERSGALVLKAEGAVAEGPLRSIFDNASLKIIFKQDPAPAERLGQVIDGKLTIDPPASTAAPAASVSASICCECSARAPAKSLRSDITATSLA